MHFCMLLVLAVLQGQSCLVLGGEKVEAHSLRCIQNLVDHLDFIPSPFEVLQLSPAHVELQPVPPNKLRASSSPLLGGDHAQHLLVWVRPLLVHIVSLSRHFLEVTGSFVQQGVEPGILKDLPCLLLQKPYLFSNDCELASRGGSGELVGLLDDLGQLDQVELVLLAHLVRAHQLEASRGLFSWHQVHCVLKVWSLRIKHHQLCLLMAAIVNVSHLYLNVIELCLQEVELVKRSTVKGYSSITF